MRSFIAKLRASASEIRGLWHPNMERGDMSPLYHDATCRVIPKHGHVRALQIKTLPRSLWNASQFHVIQTDHETLHSLGIGAGDLDCQFMLARSEVVGAKIQFAGGNDAVVK